jgi:glycosyltransferase involved in cell wall biosynthesis
MVCVSLEKPGPKILVLIAAYNEQAGIGGVLVATKRFADRTIVCDDGSSDLTAEIATGLGAEVIQHRRNKGKGEALRDLFAAALLLSPEVVVTLDGDGQHDPRDIPKLVASVREGADVAVGSRSSDQIPTGRRWGNGVLTRASRVGGVDTQSGFRAYNGKSLKYLVPTEKGMGSDAEILMRAQDNGMKIASVPVAVRYDRENSTYNPVYQGADVLLSTVKQLSIRHPLLSYGIPGFACLLVAAAFWWWTISSYVGSHTVITNVALIAVATTVVGLIFVAIAVMLWVLISVVRER